jgi:hypothetical protein
MPSRRTPSLPDKIYLIRTDDDCYYSVSNGIVTVQKTAPDPSCEVTVEYLPSNPDQFYLKGSNGGYFQYHKKKGGHIDHNPTKKFPKRPILFTLLDFGESEKDTYVFRATNGKFLVLKVNEKNRVVLGGFDGAKIKIGDPTIKKLTGNIVYALQSSTITDLTPEIALKTTLRNDSQSASTQGVTYSYLVSHKGSWTNSIGVPLPPEAVAGAKIPGLVDGMIVATENYSHVEMRSNIETKTATSLVSVPATTKGVATVLIFKAQIQVPFSYQESVWYQSGEYKERTKYGIYSNVVTYGVDVELTDLISITHMFEQYIVP